MTHDEPQAIRIRLEKMKGRANLQASAHAVLRDRYSSWNFWLTIGSLVPTATLLMFPLVTDDFVVSGLHMTPIAFKLLNAAIALFAFVAVLVQMTWRPDSLAKAHRHAVGHYTSAKFEARRLLDASELNPNAVKVLEQTYLDVQGVPDIRDDEFLKLKQRFLQKLQLSSDLDKDPWIQLPSSLKPPKP